MFQDNTTAILNVVTIVIAMAFFGYVLLLAPGPDPVVSAEVTPELPTVPAATEPVSLDVLPSPSATSTPTSTNTPAPTNTPTSTPTIQPTDTPTIQATNTPTVRHIVAPGEVLSAIAAQYGVTVEAIIAANELTEPNRLEVGQELVIPVPATPVP